MNQTESILAHLKPVSLKCPTCGQKYKGALTCRRCGTDLTLYLTMLTQAWQLREKAKRSILNNDYEEALRIAQKAQAVHYTSQGALLVNLTLALEKSSSLS